MRKPKKKIVLPSYLKLENYDGMDRLSALGWLFQLEARYQLYSSLDGFIDSSDPSQNNGQCIPLKIM